MRVLMNADCQTIGYVVLHYNTYESTVNTVSSIIHNDPKAIVVIVDNCSQNESGNLLKEKYYHNTNIMVLLLHENLGFAQGNNEGYKYIRDNFNVDYLCIMNNDVIIMDSSIKNKLYEAFIKHNYAVLGPHIILKDGTDNDFNDKFESIFYYQDLLVKRKELLIKMNNRSTLSIYLRSLYRKYIERLNKKITENDFFEKEDVVLHGCCLFFSRIYLSLFDDAFVPDTFLYGEEELLYLRCQRNNCKTVYYPSITVKHLEDVATNSINKSSKYKIIKKLEYSIQSTQILIDYYQNPDSLIVH